jgi:hypothetical protein
MRHPLLEPALLRGTFAALFGWVAASCAGAQQPAPKRMPSTQQSIAGAWRLVEHVNWDPSGKPAPLFGPNPVGYFVHDDAGRFSVQIMRTPPVRPSTAEPQTWTAGELRELFLGYYGSFGTYTLDRDRSDCVYRVEGSSRPELVGTEAHLPCRVEGDSLIIEDGKTFRRIWRRLP